MDECFDESVSLLFKKKTLSLPLFDSIPSKISLDDKRRERGSFVFACFSAHALETETRLAGNGEIRITSKILSVDKFLLVSIYISSSQIVKLILRE